MADAENCSQVTFDKSNFLKLYEEGGRGKEALKNKTSQLFSAEWIEACGPHAPLTQGSFILPTSSTPFKAAATFSKMPSQQLFTTIPFLCPSQAASSHPPLLLLFLPIKYSSLTGIKGAMQFKDYHMPLIMWLPCFLICCTCVDPNIFSFPLPACDSVRIPSLRDYRSLEWD